MKCKYKTTAIIVLLSTKTFASTPQKSVEIIDHKEGNRLITIIKGQPYYQSTGTSSNLKNTIFPFLYVSEYKIEKPTSNIGTPAVIDLVQENFINEAPSVTHQQIFKMMLNNAGNKMSICKNQDMDNKWKCIFKDPTARNIFIRLNSIKSAIVSYNFGTGYWEEKLPQENDWVDYNEIRNALIYLVTSSSINASHHSLYLQPPIYSYDISDYKNINSYLYINGTRTLPHDYDPYEKLD